MTLDQFNMLRAALASDVGDDYAGDPKRRSKIGSDAYKRDVAARQKQGGVGLDSDGPAKIGIEALGKTGALAALGVLHGLSTAFRSGREVGNAAGALVSGLSHAFTGAASGLVHVGDGILSLMLSPLGNSGAAVAKLTGGLGQALVSGLSAGGAVASAGVRIGVGLVAGIVGGLMTLGSIGLGAVLGGILGSILPGAGTLAGALFGAGLGGAVAGTVLKALAGIVGSVSSALGQALGAIGDAFGRVGSAIGDALTSIKSVLSDLIETGVQMSTATLATQRGSGMSLGASSQATALSQVLTGGSSAFSGMFQNISMMVPYQKARDEAYGVKAGGSFVDNLPGLFKRYSQFGDGPNGALQKRIMLSVVAPGAEGAVGGLFSLGGGMVNKAVRAARETALSPGEVRQNAALGFDLQVVQAQLDRLKTKLLSDLMPAITATLGAFTRFFSGHETQIVSGLEAFGKWIYVKLPTYLQAGANAFFELGKSLAASLPAVAEFGKSVYSTFAMITNGLRAGFGALVTTAGLLLAGLGAALNASPVTAWASAGVLKAGAGLTSAGRGLVNAPGLDPHGLDGFFGKIGAAGPGLTQSIQAAQNKTNGFLGGAFGTESQRAQDWKRYGPEPGSVGNSQDIRLQADLTIHPDEDSFHRFEVRVGDQTIKRLVRANQRS